MDRNRIQHLARDLGYSDTRWISGGDVQVRQWVRFKCMFGCDSYGRKGGCPPAVPAIAECRELFREYDHVLVAHFTARFDNPDDRVAWSRETNRALLELERAVFLAGHHKALLLFMDECRLCADCPGTREGCHNPRQARSCPEALGVDVFATVRAAGYPIEVLTERSQEMNRYAFLLAG